MRCSYVCAAAFATFTTKNSTASARHKHCIGYWLSSGGGRSASFGVRAAAACSGLHAHPLRPLSLIGPRSEGEAEVWSAPLNIASMEPAPAKPPPTAASAPASSEPSSNDRIVRLDMYLDYSRTCEERMKHWTLALLLPALCAAAPSPSPQPLLVGAVHDQYGLPVAGASIDAGSLLTMTDSSGTFALNTAQAAGEITISCPYCTPVHEPFQAGEPVVAIVRRYDALTQDAPSDRDLATLPYAHVASLLALRPFTVLNDSEFPVVGANVSLFGNPSTGLIVDDGIPNYDIAAGRSTFSFFPAFSTQHVDVEEPSQAFRYGDEAGGGTFQLGSFGASGFSADAMLGGQRAARIADVGPNLSSSLSVFSAPTESSDRVDAQWNFPVGGDLVSATAIASSSREIPQTVRWINSSFDAVKLSYQRVRDTTVQAEVIVDGSGYDGSLGYNTGVSAGWSDFQADAGVETHGTVHAFADLALRRSTGYWSDPSLPSPVAGTVAQTHVDAGVDSTSKMFSGSAGVGLYAIRYNGGTGQPTALNMDVVLPSATFSYNPDPLWKASISSGESFALPSLLGVYGPPGAPSLPIGQTNVTVEKLDYGDLQRVRTEIVSVDGAMHSSGGSIAWQIAPDFSLRAWTLHMRDGALPGTVNSLWATYDNASGMRVDLVERRDMVDGAPDQHFDASLSAPLSKHLHWFVATERRLFTRYYEAGLRITP